jgi:serine/threonine protein kinase/Tfp pilus assembly protein PilF
MSDASQRLERQRKLASEAKAGWLEGQPADARSLLEQHQDVSWQKSIVLDLAYEEFCHRTELGERLDVAEFCRRFQGCDQSLQRLIEVHQFFAGNISLFGPDVPEEWPQISDTVAGLELLDRLGTGAFARVYLAREPALGGRLVAAKVALQGAREAETLGQLNHRGIVPVHWVRKDEATGLTVICMPFLSRVTLFDVIEASRPAPSRPKHATAIWKAIEAINSQDKSWLSIDTPDPALLRGSFVNGVAHLGLQLAEALVAAHAKGILHLDVKPSNILLTGAGRPMLLDFNLSQSKDLVTGKVGGTLPYMASEQLRRLTDDHAPAVDVRADVFSLGATLYELLAGRPPFGAVEHGQSRDEMAREMLRRQAAGVPALHSGRGSLVDRALADLIESCLVCDPALRPQSAEELASRFRNLLRPLQRVRRWAGTHPRRAMSAGGTAAILLAALTVTAATRDSASVREFKSAIQDFQEGQYSAAVEHCNLALQSDKNLYAARFLRGRSYLKQGQHETAYMDFNYLVDKASDGRIQAAQGMCLSLSKQYHPAKVRYAQALQRGLESPELLNNLGYVSMLSGQFQDADEFLNRATRLAPMLQAPYCNLARLALRQAKFGSQEKLLTGIADVETAIRIGPPSGELYFDAACLYALASVHNSEYLEAAFRYLDLSSECGLDPEKLDDRILDRLKADSRFQTFKLRPATAAAAKLWPATRNLDPLEQLPDEPLLATGGAGPVRGSL